MCVCGVCVCVCVCVCESVRVRKKIGIQIENVSERSLFCSKLHLFNIIIMQISCFLCECVKL